MFKEQVENRQIGLTQRVFHLENGNFTISFPQILTLSHTHLMTETSESLPEGFVKDSPLYPFRNVIIKTYPEGSKGKKSGKISQDRRDGLEIYVDRVLAEAKKYLVEQTAVQEGKKKPKNPYAGWIEEVEAIIPVLSGADENPSPDFPEDNPEEKNRDYQESEFSEGAVNNTPDDEKMLELEAANLTQWLVTDLIIDRAARTHLSLNQSAFRKVMQDHLLETGALEMLGFFAGIQYYPDATYALAIADKFVLPWVRGRVGDRLNQLKGDLWHQIRQNGPLIKLEEY